MTSELPIRVTPRAGKAGIGNWRRGRNDQEELEVRVSEAPSNGAANEAVTKLLASLLGVSRSEVAIVAGKTARHKRVAIPLSLEEARRRLGV